MSSVKMAIASISTWYGIIGFVVAVIALVNLTVAIFSIGLIPIIETMLQAYRDIFHKFIGVLTAWLPFKLPPYVKDIIVLWTIFGSAVGKSKDRFMAVRSGSLADAGLSLLTGKQKPSNLEPDKSQRLLLAYNNSPRWLRIIIDTILWPLSILPLFKRPWASVGKARNFSWYSVSDVKFIDELGNDTRKKEGYIATFDLRIILAIQLLSIVLAAIAVIGLNTTVSS